MIIYNNYLGDLMKQKLEDIQKELQKLQIDGWLLYDFRRSNDLACKFLEIPFNQLLSRRLFYWIPSQGQPVKIVSSVEDPLKHLPGISLSYKGWESLDFYLDQILQNVQVIAMEYSPRNAIPYLSKVDAGTLELVKDFGVDVVSSCDLLQQFTSVLTPQQINTHIQAGIILDKIAEDTWLWIARHLSNKQTINEYDVQQYILKEFATYRCVTSDPPICAVNTNSSNPHYNPQSLTAKNIQEGDFVLIDLWCKLDREDAIYADITRVGVASKSMTPRQQEIFRIVRDAQENATQLVKKRIALGQPIQGWEVDQAARSVITEAGYGDYFVHRTGHSIDTSDHGSGANIDNLETQDLRYLLPGTCFSIEPGIYLPNEFGVRLEYDLLFDLDHTIKITGGVQNQIKVLFS